MPVYVNAIRVRFGECIQDLLHGASGVEATFSQGDLHLRPGNVSFEHAPHCPAREWAAPKEKGDVRVAVAAVVESSDHKVLLTRRHPQLRSFPNVFVVPGGHMEAGESLLEAALREVKEEVGMDDLRPVRLLGVWESCYPHRVELGAMTHHHVVVYVHARLSTSAEDTRLNLQTNEVHQVAWVDMDQINAVCKDRKDVEIEILQAEEEEEPHTTNSNDTWQENRSNVERTGKVMTASEIFHNITAGTHFALRKYLMNKATKNDDNNNNITSSSGIVHQQDPKKKSQL